MKILISYRGIPQSPGWSTGAMLVKAFNNLGHICNSYAKYYMQNKWVEDPQKILKDSYDLYLNLECGDGDIFYKEMLYINSKIRASFWFDVALYPERWMRETALISSKINFVANKNFLDMNFHTYYLPYASDSELHFRKQPIKKERMFALVGSDRPERRQLAEKLGIELKSGIFRDEYIDYLSKSVFTINDVAGGGSGLIPMRATECLMAGSKLITPKNDGCYEIGLPCIEYNSIDDLVEICKIQSQIPIEIYNNMINQEQNIVLQNHTYEKRAEEILKVIFDQ